MNTARPLVDANRVCHATRIINGHQWVCVRLVHDDGQTVDVWRGAGGWVRPLATEHWFVRRLPPRELPPRELPPSELPSREAADE